MSEDTVDRVHSALIPLLLRRGAAMGIEDIRTVAQAAVEASGITDYESAEKWAASCLNCGTLHDRLADEAKRAEQIKFERDQYASNLFNLRATLRRLAE